MAHNIPVNCLMERTWDTVDRAWDGVLDPGILIDFSTQTADDNSGKIIPVGIVLLEDDTIQSLPLEFIFQLS